ncbi:hypothetical protein LJC42_08185 [Eubacteriales bacterium OttesenSCG-928-K08]|nr:hypothetical protein [Eubacteriales bacterium OttesenSCG-928-K08]
MSYINLKRYYGFDLYADIPEHIILVLEEWKKAEHAANERDRYHRPLPLDLALSRIIDPYPLPDEQYIQKLASQQLHQALLEHSAVNCDGAERCLWQKKGGAGRL